MAAKTMAELQATLRKKAEAGSGNTGGDNASYRFWDMKDKETAVLRFTEDGDPENGVFWVERQTIRIPFQGVVGGENPTTNAVEVTVQCADMFEPKTCPITRAIAPWWKNDKPQALKYWKKRSFLYQGFVVKSPFVEENPPENPIRRFVLGPKLHKIIEASLNDPEMPNLPYDPISGRDFRIIRGKAGEFANYDTSSWSMNQRPLSETELLAIEQYGLWDLKQYRGRRPDADELSAIEAMFHASVAGEPFDFDAFGSYYRPYDKNRSNDNVDEPVAPVARKAAPVPAPVTTASDVDDSSNDSVTETVAPTASTAKLTAQEVIAKLRAQSKK